VLPVLCALSLAMFSAAIQASADETNAVPSSPAPRLEETNSQQTLHAILLLEEQIRSNQLAIERSGNEAREVATRNLEMMSNGCRRFEPPWRRSRQSFPPGAHRSWRLCEVRTASR